MMKTDRYPTGKKVYSWWRSVEFDHGVTLCRWTDELVNGVSMETVKDKQITILLSVPMFAYWNPPEFYINHIKKNSIALLEFVMYGQFRMYEKVKVLKISLCMGGHYREGGISKEIHKEDLTNIEFDKKNLMAWKHLR
jgi:hypothetical protein